MQKEFGRYHLVRHLATGGMGEVYLAEAKGAAGFAKRVVVKTLRQDLAADTELVKQFVAEGQVLEALDHPNIAQIIDLGLQGDTYFLAMEYVEGFDLRAVQRALPADNGFQKLRESSVLYIVGSVARALEHAQSRRGTDGRPLRIVHHDVTPSNIMVRRDGHVKLVDFGVARSVLMSRMSAGALRGKLPYLSPEHARMQRVDRRADLFSLGLVAMELLSGQRALDVAEPEALEDAYARLPARIMALTEQNLCSGETARLIGQMLELQAEARPATAGEVADRAEAQLVASGEASPARTLAGELEAAFVVLEARASSFDQTLSQILGVSGVEALDATGTLSLPGIEVVQVAQASARDEGADRPPPARPRGRKRLATAAFALLAAAVAIGFWLGDRQGGDKLASPSGPVLRTALPPAATAQAADAHAMAPDVLAPAEAAAMVPAPDAAAVAVPATGLAAAATASAVAPETAETAETGRGDGGRHGAARKVHSAEPAFGVVQFRVLPADCKVSVDGKRRHPTDTNRYQLRLPPGDHRVRIEDPDNGQWKEIEVKALREGEERKLMGTSLGADLP